MAVRISTETAPGTPGILILIFLILCGAVVAPAAARYASPEGSNAGINPGDTVFNGERGINFSALQPFSPLLPPLYLACDDGGSAVALQRLDDGAVMTGRLNVESRYLDRPFRLYNGTWGTALSTVANPTGTIEVRAGTALGADADLSRTDTRTPAVIPTTLNVQFKLDSTNLNSGNFAGDWYEYELKTPGGVPLRTVTNMTGNSVSLTGLTGDPSADNNALAFNIADQNLNPEEGTYTMKFTAYNGNDAFYTAEYRFDVVRYRLAMNASPETVEPDQTTTLIITGTPYTHYTIVIDDTRDGKPEFPSSGTYDIYTSKHNVTVHPDWSGTVSVPLYIPVPSGEYNHTTSIYYPKVYETRNPSTSVTAKVVVEPGTTKHTLELYEIDPGLDEFFSLGDTIEIEGTLGAPAKDTMPLYFYLVGPNLDTNGVKPSNPRIAVVDGDVSTFDFITVSKDQSDFMYRWDTSQAAGLEPGTYTIFVTLDPVGYNQRALSETETKDYVKLDLNDPSINVMFPNEAPGFFAQGDHIVSLWTARGSPAKAGENGKIRYYIFGSNLQYTGLREFPLTKSGSAESAGKTFPGYSGLNLPRSFSANLAAGEYTVVYQHPMYNQKFDLRPVEGGDYSGALTTLTTPDGNVSFRSLQAPEALRALEAAFGSSFIDDSMVTQTFTIEKPSVDLSPVQNYEVGEAIPFTGTTNLECPMEYEYNQIDLPGDRVVLSLYTAEMYNAGKTQSINRIYSGEAYPAKTAPGAASRTISFTIPEKISAQMKPGDYVVVLRCEDIKYEKEIFFTLHESGYRKEHGLADPGTGEVLSTVPAPTWGVTSTATYVPTPFGTPASGDARETDYVPTPFAIPTTEAPGLPLGYGSIFFVLSALGVFCMLLYMARR
ncbi:MULTISPECIES: hypothetical protein [unclassified Methanoculleus]|jgi:hypothetical protein|uniref:hypothetical protein n=1 Tax=unclassified Methanoculleus TaxID=2619537 RepID=UPI0025E547CB|nr:hypothetical protein [Methanoculleus sp. UBA377]